MRFFKHFIGLLVVLVLLGLGIRSVSALDIPPVPKDIPVVDQTNTLNDEQKNNLAAKIAEERNQTGNQIAILMIPSLNGDALEDYSLKVARGWGIGEKGKDNGVLLLVVKNDRKVRIEVGYGLEGPLPDARASRIIRDRIIPNFRDNKFYEGIDSGLQGIIMAIHNENDASLKNDTTSNPKNLNWENWIWLLFFAPIWLGSLFARSRSWWAGGVVGGVIGIILSFVFGFLFVGLVSIAFLAPLGLLLDFLVSKNYHTRKAQGLAPSWWAGGSSFGGSGSGGFGGFGGGSFGGGGSSGSW